MLRVLSILVLVALPMAQIARGAMIPGTVHCCCGDHEAAEDCGCPECPASGHHDDGDDGDGHHDEAPPTTSFRACGAEGSMLSVGAFPPMLVPPLLHVATTQRAPRSMPPPDARPPEPVIDRAIVPS